MLLGALCCVESRRQEQSGREIHVEVYAAEKKSYFFLLLCINCVVVEYIHWSRQPFTIKVSF